MPKPDINKLIELNKSRNNGELRCYLCNKPLNQTKRMTFVIEHKDNNRKNNDNNNLEISCRSCNKKKDVSSIYKALKVKGLTLNYIYTDARKKILNDKLRIDSMAMAKHIHGEPIFRDFAVQIVKQKGIIRADELVNAGCELAGVQPKKGYEYLSKLTSLTGVLEIVEKDSRDHVVLKDEEKKKYIKMFKDKYK